jgi:hypothetical protein
VSRQPFDVRRQVAAQLCFVVLCASGCAAKRHTLEKLHCDTRLSDLVTHTLKNEFNIGSFACARFETTSAEAKQRLTSGCHVFRSPFESLTYPGAPLPTVPPPWWDLHDGDAVEYAFYASDDGYWEGLAYRKATEKGYLWYLCGGAT